VRRQQTQACVDVPSCDTLRRTRTLLREKQSLDDRNSRSTFARGTCCEHRIDVEELGEEGLDFMLVEVVASEQPGFVESPSFQQRDVEAEVAPLWWTPRKGLRSREIRQCRNERYAPIRSK